MKRSLVLALVFALVLAGSAMAKVQDFGKFTVDVIEGWTANRQANTVTINKNDNTCGWSVTIADASGLTTAQLAEAFAAEFKKSFATVSTPVADKDGDYSWDMETNGVNTHAMLHSEDGEFMLITTTAVEKGADEISTMIGSINVK